MRKFFLKLAAVIFCCCKTFSAPHTVKFVCDFNEESPRPDMPDSKIIPPLPRLFLRIEGKEFPVFCSFNSILEARGHWLTDLRKDLEQATTEEEKKSKILDLISQSLKDNTFVDLLNVLSSYSTPADHRIRLKLFENPKVYRHFIKYFRSEPYDKVVEFVKDSLYKPDPKELIFYEFSLKDDAECTDLFDFVIAETGLAYRAIPCFPFFEKI